MVPWSGGVGWSFGDRPFELRSGTGLIKMLSRFWGPGLATSWAGWACLPGYKVHEASKVDWVLAAWPTMRPVLLLGFGIDVPKANGTGWHGWWWFGCSGLCPISVGWKPFIHGSTIILGQVDYRGVLVAHAHGKGRVQDGGDKEIQRRALRLYWPASRYALVYRWCVFLSFSYFDLSFLSFLKKGWAKCLLIRPFETRLFLYWSASRCANGARFFTWFADSTGRAGA